MHNVWYRIVLLSLGLLSVSACNREQTLPHAQEKSANRIEAYAPSESAIQTRTSLSQDGAGCYAVLWNAEDAIRVNGIVSEKTDLDPDNHSHAFFTVPGIQPPFEAVYPASASSDGQSLTLPSHQSYSDENIDPNAAVMLGTGTSSLSFTHVLSFLMLEVESRGSDIKSIILRSRTMEPMSGVFTANYSGTPSLSPASLNGAAVTLDCNDGIPSGKAIIAFPAGTYPSGITIVAGFTNGSSLILNSKKSFTAEAGKVYRTPLSVADKPTRKTLSLSPFTSLNQGKDPMLSHADECSRSSLAPMAGNSWEIGETEAFVSYPSYPRIRKIGNSTYALIWQNNGTTTGNGKDTHYALSDDLETWTYKGLLFASRNVISSGRGGETVLQYHTNADMKLLADGRICAMSSFWTPATYRQQECKGDHGIRIKFSSDGANTWSEEQVIYNGPCWEPFIVETPSGILQCYFAESRPWISDSHSGTSMVQSADGGVTWTPSLKEEPIRVMRNSWVDADSGSSKFTWQMPVGVVLAGGSRKAFALESVTGRLSSPVHYISIAYSPESGVWTPLEGSSVGPMTDAQVNFTRGTAPSLVQFPSGETVLSYENGNMKYRLGDQFATHLTQEGNLFSHQGAWSSLETESAHTLLAVDRKGSGSAGCITLRRMALNHSVYASQRAVDVDADDKEWSTMDHALYLGGESIGGTLRFCTDGTFLYFLAEVADNKLSKGQSVTLYLGSLDKMLSFGPSGLLSSTCSNVRLSIAYDGSLGNNADMDNGYRAEGSIPLSALSLSGSTLIVNASLTGSDGETVTLSTLGQQEKWPHILGLESSQSKTGTELLSLIDYNFNWE